jgi:hypothetical protein
VRSLAVAGRWYDAVNDQAKRLRVQIMAMTKNRRACQRMNESTMRTFGTVLSAMIPAKKLRTGKTGMPDPWSALAGRRLEVFPTGSAFSFSIGLYNPGIKLYAVSNS